ncbi:MAG: hypothetical protein V4447_10820 [Pseudomonadota bacterium]
MTIAQIKKLAGVQITKANATFNGRAAYKVEGMPGIFTKSALIAMFC